MIRPVYYVHCDGEDCIWHCGEAGLTRSDAWQKAKALGWRAVGGKHYCPRCATGQTKKIPE